MLCKELLVDAERWVQPIEDQHGRIVNILNKLGYADKFDIQFLQDEFEWMKDYQVLEREQYLEIPRTGRKKSLGKSERELVFDIFEQYQLLLQRDNREDWAGVPARVLEAIQQGAVAVPRFDAILIDEAQDFAPTWFEVLRSLLNPETGIIYMAADSTQRIYRKVTWKSLGLNVVGRSRVLRRAYRNTYEIAFAAYQLISQNEYLIQDLREDEEGLLEPDFDTRSMPHGDYPILAKCKDSQDEFEFIAKEIQRLLHFGYEPGEILVLCRRTTQVTNCLASLRSYDLPVAHLKDDSSNPGKYLSVGTLHAAKGLEFRVVFILHLDSLFQHSGMVAPADAEMIQVEELRLLYVGMTRARERLYLTYKRQLPEPLQYLGQFIMPYSH
jgi:superfamily I DNA/RNA helicase